MKAATASASSRGERVVVDGDMTDEGADKHGESGLEAGRAKVYASGLKLELL